MSDNATFHYFKPSGKWYTTGRGNLPREVFEPYLGAGDARPTQVNTRSKLLAANGNRMPGLSTTAADYLVIVVADEDVEWGWPICLHALED